MKLSTIFGRALMHRVFLEQTPQEVKNMMVNVLNSVDNVGIQCEDVSSTSGDQINPLFGLPITTWFEFLFLVADEISTAAWEFGLLRILDFCDGDIAKAVAEAIRVWNGTHDAELKQVVTRMCEMFGSMFIRSTFLHQVPPQMRHAMEKIFRTFTEIQNSEISTTFYK